VTTQIKRANQPVEWVRMGDLSVDKRLQRELKPGWVDLRRDLFDPLAFGVLTVSERANGNYVVLDGQHRDALLRALGWGSDQLVPCTVLRGLSFEQEAATFLKLNDRVRVSAFDQFRQRLNAGEPDAKAIHAIVRSLGLRLGVHSNGHGEISAVSALERVYRPRRNAKERHPEALAAALNVIHEAFGDESKVFQGDLISGLGSFMHRYLKVVDMDSLIKKMAKEYGKGGAYQLIGHGRAAKQIHHGSLAYNIAGVTVNLYNRQRRVGVLDNWWK
jgi:hypothetical protein